MDEYLKIIKEKHAYARFTEPRFREDEYLWVISKNVIHCISNVCISYNPRAMCLELLGIKIIPTESIDVIELYHEVKRYV